MTFDWLFFFNSVLLGVGLAMDAFSVSLANGLNEHCMRKRKMCVIAGTFAVFQALMPMIGWVCVHTFIEKFCSFEKFIPWIALVRLVYIGAKMLIEGIKNQNCPEACSDKLSFSMLMMQGVATSIDALSVGFTISDYNAFMAIICSLIIAAVTFIICMGGLYIGKKFGTEFSGKASILGGAILIFIGIEIFVKGII